MSKLKIQVNGGEIVEVNSVSVIYEVDHVDMLEHEELPRRLSMDYTPQGCCSELTMVEEDLTAWVKRAFLHDLVNGNNVDKEE